MLITTVLSFIIVPMVSYGAHFPSSIKLCHKSSSDFEACVTKEFTKALKVLSAGYKSLSLPVIDPLFVKELHLKGDGSTNLDQHYYNVHISGMANTTIDKFKLEETDNSVTVKVTGKTYNAALDADYELKGQIVVFPISAKGRCRIDLKDIIAEHQITSTKVTRNGKIYMKLEDYKYDITSTGDLNFYFSNIIPSNEQLSEVILKTINENSKTVFRDIKPGFEQSQKLIYSSIVSNIFNKVPLSDFFLS